MVRALAVIIDGIVLGVINGIIGGIFFGGNPSASSGLSAVAGLLYYLYFWTGSGGGATLGMRLFKIKVVKTDGTILTYGGAFVRYLMLIVSFAVFFLGVIWVAFDKNKQGWHDKVAGT